MILRENRLALQGRLPAGRHDCAEVTLTLTDSPQYRSLVTQTYPLGEDTQAKSGDMLKFQKIALLSPKGRDPSKVSLWKFKGCTQIPQFAPQRKPIRVSIFMELQSSLKTPPARHLIHGLNPLITLLKERNIDPEPLIEKVEIPLEAIGSPTYQLTPLQELGFTERVIRELDCPGLGLIVGRRYHLSTYGLLGLAVMTSENLLSGMRVLYKNILMTWTYMQWMTTIRDGVAYVNLDKLRDLGGCHQFMVDRGLVGSHMIFEEALGRDIPLREVRLKHAKPSYYQDYERYFKCPVIFDADENRYAFSAHLLYEPLAQAEPESARAYAEECEKICTLLARNYTFSDTVRNYILSSPKEIFSLEAIANYLRMTPRTVQRKLRQENITYKDILEDIRKNLAIEYLQSTQFTLEDIAVRLGYADASSFCHAYKRWKGDTPSYVRHKLRNSGVNSQSWV